MRRLLVVSHTHLYSKLEEYGSDYDGSVTSMMGQERDWMESQLPTPTNESEESEGSKSSDDSFTEKNLLPKSNTRRPSQTQDIQVNRMVKSSLLTILIIDKKSTI